MNVVLYGAGKRLLDCLVAGSLLIVTAPIVIAVAFRIKRESLGPVFFSAKRVGRHEKPFFMYKFRTMVANASALGGESTAAEDPRITKVGKWLRRTKLDELPQLFNVLKGEMSLVGPRPTTEYSLYFYRPEDKIVFSVAPGITDYASLEFKNEGEILAGKRNADRAYYELIAPGKIALQIKYVKERSLRTDLKILVQTFYAVVFCPFGLNRPRFAADSEEQQRFINERLMTIRDKAA